MYQVYSHKRRRNHFWIVYALATAVTLGGGYLLFKDKIAPVYENSAADLKDFANEAPAPAIPVENKNIHYYDESASLNVTYYYACGHQKEEHLAIPAELVGKTIEMIKEENPEYEIYDYTDDNISANIIRVQQCDDHYIIKLVGRQLNVYHKERTDVIERTMDINMSDLYEEDIEILRNGIEVGSKTEMLEILENFAS